MLNKLKNIIQETDNFLLRKFGTDKSVKVLENIKEARLVFSYLNEFGEEGVVRFVGGCVRKALCGEKIDDIDLATLLTPEEVKKRLIGSQIKVIDTGITHGTLTLILNKKKFEITTLRKDISTDGRHAKVQFTSNWEEDASRRDFTINAIYVDIEGRIFDPLNGISDLHNGIVKFIRSSDERIQEDYLRILRYFRFFTKYSKVEHNPEIINSIKKNINGINKISNERIIDELKKILLLQNIQKLFLNEDSKEIILNIFPQFKYHERLKNIGKLSKNIKKLYDTDLMLALLILDETKDYEYFCYKYKTSNNTKERFKNLSANFENSKNKKFYLEKNIRKLIFLTDKKNVKDMILFSGLISKKIEIFQLEKLIDFVETSKIPRFPISGDDLIRQGYQEGQELGKTLKRLEEKWVANDFTIDKKIVEKFSRK